MAAPAKSTPRDAQILAAIIKDMGVQEHEPRVINQLLEFLYRYATDILDDAKVYCSHAGRKNLEVDDIKLAAQCRMDHSFTSPPPRDLLMEIARHKNSQPLPLIKPSAGLRLPPDRYCLSLPNYKIKSSKKRLVGLASSHQLPGQRINFASLQGAGAGRVSGGTLTVVSKPAAQPTVTIINKTVALASSSGSKPTIRVTPATASTTQVPKPVMRMGTSSGSMTSIVPTVVTPRPTVVLNTSAPAKLTISTTSSSTPTTVSAVSAASSLTGVSGVKRKLEDDDYDK